MNVMDAPRSTAQDDERQMAPTSDTAITSDEVGDYGEKTDDASKQQPQRVIGRPWPPGVSGNPSGRGKGVVSLTESVRGELARELKDSPNGRRVVDALAKRIVKYAGRGKTGDAGYAKEVWDRIDGRTPQIVSVTADGEVLVTHSHQFDHRVFIGMFGQLGAVDAIVDQAQADSSEVALTSDQ